MLLEQIIAQGEPLMDALNQELKPLALGKYRSEHLLESWILYPMGRFALSNASTWGIIHQQIS